jgi:hypothetical protein
MAERIEYAVMQDGALQPGDTGIRPKIYGPGEAAPDFMIQGTRDHAVKGLENLFRNRVAGARAIIAPRP